MEVVATTPFTVEVITPDPAERVLELMIEEVEVTPLTTEVSSFTAEVSEFWSMKLAVVVEVTPLTVEVRVKLLVEVETVSTLVVPALMMDWRSVEVATPLTVEVRTVPEAVSPLEVMIEEVPMEPPRLEVRVLPVAERVLVVLRLVMVALVASRSTVLVVEAVRF